MASYNTQILISQYVIDLLLRVPYTQGLMDKNKRKGQTEVSLTESNAYPWPTFQGPRVINSSLIPGISFH